MSQDYLTVLSAAASVLTTKRWKADGSMAPAADAKNFDLAYHPVSNIHELSYELEDLESRTNSGVIREFFKNNVFELCQAMGDPAYAFGKVMRRQAVLDVVAHHWVMLDVDGHRVEGFDPNQFPTLAIEDFILKCLPSSFHNASYHWKLSSSAGHPSIPPGTLKAHVWFWLATPLTSAQLDAWALKNAPAIDRSVFRTAQWHFTALPVFDAGVADPIAVRSGLECKTVDMVPIELSDDELAALPKAKKTIDAASADPVVQILSDGGYILSERQDGGFNITCPREDQHTSESAESSTIYYPAHTRGYVRGHFKCLHAHCSEVDDSEFHAAIGYVPSVLDAAAVFAGAGSPIATGAPWTAHCVPNYRGPTEPSQVLQNLLKNPEAPSFKAWDAGDMTRIISDLAWRTGGNCELLKAVLALRPDYQASDALDAAIAGAIASQTSFQNVRENTGHDLNLPLADPLAVFHPEQVKTKLAKKSEVEYLDAAEGTAENLTRLVKAYDVRIRYNELSHDLEVWMGNSKVSGDLARNAQISVLEDLARINKYPHTAVANHMQKIAMADPYNPALEWVQSKVWDGVERMDDLFACLELVSPAHAPKARSLFQKWFVGAVALLAGITDEFSHALVFVDETGGQGKTRFFRSWCPKEFRIDGQLLEPRDKDSVMLVTSHWLVELGELDATFKKSEIAQLKAFLSKNQDDLRPPYARATNTYQRRTAFMGTVNQLDFLVDDTNNRRFWPIHVESVRYDHSIDMQQVWAECLVRAQQGERYWLSREENQAIGTYTDDFRVQNALEERLLLAYDHTIQATRWITATEVLMELGILNANRSDQTRVGILLRKRFKFNKGKLSTYNLPERR